MRSPQAVEAVTNAAQNSAKEEKKNQPVACKHGSAPETGFWEAPRPVPGMPSATRKLTYGLALLWWLAE
jgi:hypothetical protein